MATRWLTEDYSYERVILAGDIGGTNANIALAGQTGKKFTIIVKSTFKTAEIAKFPECLKIILKEAQKKAPDLSPSLCCISAAGPVKDNRCRLSNIPWEVDRQEIEKTIGIKSLVINDFMAISYGIALLDVDNPEQITKLRHIDGSESVQTGSVRAVVGAGTGLGAGFLVEDNGRFKAFPSEGGHIGFAPFDKETRQLQEYLAGCFGELMETELYVSGAGIANIFYYFRDVKKIAFDGVLAQIDKAEDSQKPELISRYADENPVCREILGLFVKLYGRFAADIAACVLPTMGMYLAGGIAAKNEKFFIEDNQFMRYFDNCFHPNIRQILRTIPVYIIKDYSVSLYGAANAACSLMI